MESRGNNKIIIILGPTASGKSAAAIKLAKKIGGEIISADSRQIYRKMDTGTGKINGFFNIENEAFISEEIPHYAIDIVELNKDFNVSDFKKYAKEKINNILSREKIPIICGGTGFWIKAITSDEVFPKVEPDFALREKLKNETVEKLFEKLKKLDPERAQTIDSKNKVRLIRAIEICQTLGSVPRMQKSERSDYKFLQIGILQKKEILDERIKKNVQQRFANGMVEEVENLHKKYNLDWEKIKSFGLGYKLIPEYLEGGITSEKELLEKIYLAEKNYAKRQMTWFKKEKNIIWLKDYEQIEKEVGKFLKNN